MCDILIPIWNELKKTKRCLSSVLKHTSPPFHLILIDNASLLETADYLIHFQKQHPGLVTLVRNPENLGFVKAVNQGFRLFKSEMICLLNNDTVAFKNWLTHMILAAKFDSSVGIVNPGPYHLGYKKPWYLSWEQFASYVAKKEKGKYTTLSMASGFCMLIKRSVLQTIGEFDENYGMGYYEDSDFSRRAVEAGFKIVHARSALIEHEGSASFRHRKDKDRLAETNRKYFEARHGRRLQLGYFFSPSVKDLPASALRTMTDQLRQNHQLLIACKKSFRLPEELTNHANVRRLAIYSCFSTEHFFLKTAFKKKKLDGIYVGEKTARDQFCHLQSKFNRPLPPIELLKD